MTHEELDEILNQVPDDPRTGHPPGYFLFHEELRRRAERFERRPRFVKPKPPQGRGFLAELRRQAQESLR